MRQLGEILIEQGALVPDRMEAAFRSKPRGTMIGDWLVRQQIISTQQLGKALAEQFGVPYVDVDASTVDPQVARLLPEDFSRSTRCAAFAVDHGELMLAMVAPDDIQTIAEAELMTGYEIKPIVALAEEIQSLIVRAYDDRSVARQTIIDMKFAELREASAAGEGTVAIAEFADQTDAPVVRLVQAILSGAVTANASDIHLEPHKPEMRCRYRVDGELQQVMTIPNHVEESLLSRIKVMADMDTTESRRPQDGHLTIFENGKKVGFRVSGIPTVDGQKLVLRLLDEGNKTFALNRIGLTPFAEEQIRLAVDKPHGMFVVTGPTGSGKSTTLYAILQHLNREDCNIVTVEDPVEFRLSGVNQVQSDNEFGMGFANALKFIMRQDPDVIMVGEIRDSETAQTAVQAALTGHLMISTLHTNDAVGAVQRLADLGVDNFKIAGALLGSVAQRLLRQICDHCKEPVEANQNLIAAIDPERRLIQQQTLYKGRGCKKCLGTGYRGRIPIFEIMPINSNITMAIESGLPHSKLRQMAIEAGMVELGMAGLEQVIAGRTTLDEVYFKTSGDRRYNESTPLANGRRVDDISFRGPDPNLQLRMPS